VSAAQMGLIRSWHPDVPEGSTSCRRCAIRERAPPEPIHGRVRDVGPITVGTLLHTMEKSPPCEPRQENNELLTS
jgi:hypothetical protein